MQLPILSSDGVVAEEEKAQYPDDGESSQARIALSKKLFAARANDCN
jgi:hypothetical protein